MRSGGRKRYKQSAGKGHGETAWSRQFALRARVFRLLKKIPRGKAATYSQIAEAAETHPRAVAAILRSNKDPNSIPCYKVVMSDGKVGGYSGRGGVREKIRRLKADGVRIRNGRVAANLIKFLQKKTHLLVGGINFATSLFDFRYTF